MDVHLNELTFIIIPNRLEALVMLEALANITDEESLSVVSVLNVVTIIAAW